jgi:hypothetical protein
MDGLLLRLHHMATGRPEPSFWSLFGPVRRDLDRLAWCLPDEPWFTPPPDFDYDSASMAFAGRERTSVQLWRPGLLSRYADQFGEELFELWGIDPARDDPQSTAALFVASPWEEMDEVIRRHGQVHLFYIDNTCWEIYAREPTLLDRVRQGLVDRPSVVVYDSRDDQRGVAFRAAGLSDLWKVVGRPL